MTMPQWCYLAKGAKRPSHTTNTIKFDRIPFDPCNSIKRFDLSPFDQKNSTYLQPPLLSKLRIFERTHPSHCYTRDAINAFIRDNWNRRWNSPHNDNFLKNFITNLPQETIHSPLLDGNPLLANVIIDLVIGSSRRLAENLWKLSCTPSPLCIYGTSEQNSYH